MAGHSRSKNGVASLAFVPAIHVLEFACLQDVDARHKAGHDDTEFGALVSKSHLCHPQYLYEKTTAMIV
jgi:hypothetical protein